MIVDPKIGKEPDETEVEFCIPDVGEEVAH